MEGFAKYAEEAFYDSLLRELREDYPQLFGSAPWKVGEKMLSYGRKKAKKYGFTQRNTITGFIRLMAAIAPDFDEHPDIAPLLTDRDEANQDARLEELFSMRPSEEAWRRAMLEGDITAWLDEE